MTSISFGPFVFADDRLAALCGIAAFFILAALASAKVGMDLDRWAYPTAVVGLGFARLGHVITHLSAFSDEPLRALAIWQGGFSLPWGLVGAAAFSAWRVRLPRQRLWAAGAIGGGLLTWALVARMIALPLGRELPKLALQDLKGAEVSLRTDGRPLVLNLWASWCPPCRREMPTLVGMANAEPHVKFVLVNQGDPAAAVQRFLGRAGLSTPDVALDSSSALSADFEVAGLPATFFFDKAGHLVSTHAGEISKEELSDRVRSLEDAP